MQTGILFTQITSDKNTRMKVEDYHIGNAVKAVLKEQERSEAWLARKVHCDPGNFNRILKRPSMDMDLLRRISINLNHNFFLEYSSFVKQQIELFYSKSTDSDQENLEQEIGL